MLDITSMSCRSHSKNDNNFSLRVDDFESTSSGDEISDSRCMNI